MQLAGKLSIDWSIPESCSNPPAPHLHISPDYFAVSDSTRTLALGSKTTTTNLKFSSRSSTRGPESSTGILIGGVQNLGAYRPTRHFVKPLLISRCKGWVSPLPSIHAEFEFALYDLTLFYLVLSIHISALVLV